MRQCTLCNEAFDHVQLQFGEVIEVEGEFWHVECFDEYFGEIAVA